MKPSDALNAHRAELRQLVTVRGTGNVFADLQFADVDTHLLKAGLVGRIHDLLADQKLTQSAAAARMGISQPDVSRLLRGQFRHVSVERLMRMLTKLSCDVDIVVRARNSMTTAKDTIHLHASPG